MMVITCKLMLKFKNHFNKQHTGVDRTGQMPRLGVVRV